MADTKKTAGAFDIRNFIGMLLGLYGIILTLMGLFGDKELDKTGGVNANLWTGLVLLVVLLLVVAHRLTLALGVRGVQPCRGGTGLLTAAPRPRSARG